MPILLYSLPGAHIDIALSKHSFVTCHVEVILLLSSLLECQHMHMKYVKDSIRILNKQTNFQKILLTWQLIIIILETSVESSNSVNDYGSFSS